MVENENVIFIVLSSEENSEDLETIALRLASAPVQKQLMASDTACHT